MTKLNRWFINHHTHTVLPSPSSLSHSLSPISTIIIPQHIASTYARACHLQHLRVKQVWTMKQEKYCFLLEVSCLFPDLLLESGGVNGRTIIVFSYAFGSTAANKKTQALTNRSWLRQIYLHKSYVQSSVFGRWTAVFRRHQNVKSHLRAPKIETLIQQPFVDVK